MMLRILQKNCPNMAILLQYPIASQENCPLCHIYGNSRLPIFHFTYKTASMLAYLCCMKYHKRRSFVGLLRSDIFLWMLTFTCFLKLMVCLWTVSNSLNSLLKTMSGWPMLFRFGTYGVQFKSINWTLSCLSVTIALKHKGFNLKKALSV